MAPTPSPTTSLSPFLRKHSKKSHLTTLSYNQNITLRFFTSSQTDTCDYGNSSTALTFTTSSFPVVGKCFNVADLFGGNATTGYVNQTRNVLGSARKDNPGIHWLLENKDAYDPSANYSSMLYRQHVQNPASDAYKPGHFANRWITVYGGVNCSELDPTAKKDEKKPLLPWFGWSCFSEGQGSCGDTPYNIASFYVNPVENSRSGTCWDFAYMGAAASIRVGSGVVMGALAGVVVAVWGVL